MNRNTSFQAMFKQTMPDTQSARRRLAAIIVACLFIGTDAGPLSVADDTPIKGQRIFTAGHSLLLYMPAILNDIAAKANVKGHVQAGVQGIGGSHVFQHWNLSDDRNKVKPALRSGTVDVLTLSPIYLPDDGIEKLAALGLEHNPVIRVTVQEFWIPYDDPTVLEAGRGPKQVNRDSRTVAELRQMHAAYFQSMDDHVRALNRKFGRQTLFIVPVGQAVLGLREKVIKGEVPEITKQSELFTDALGHAHAPIRVLSTYCHFAVIYRRSPIGLPVPAALSKQPEAEKLNRLLQELAWDAVCKHPLSGVKQSKIGAQPAMREWQRIVVPGVRDAARKFANPPAEYSLTMWWFWNGEMTDANIRRDLADLKAHGVRSVMLWCYNGLEKLEYLSPAWFERVKFAVQEARRAGIRVWIADEGCYPSGFIGGKVTRERPWQRMQILTAKKAPAGQMEVKPEYRTSATRYIHTPGFRKDESCSLFDALDPVATGDFLKDVHEQYCRHIGDEFGRTVLGFMGDEPSFPGVPYTAGIFEEFERRKGYDVRPHLPKLFAKEPRDEDRRVRADYWDVWSDLYRDNFFKPQADWCARHGMEFQMHLCGEEDMKTLVALNGDYFKCMRPVQVPGVDAIWRQIWPDKVADYAKLASSAAHVWGRPRAFSEGYAVYGRGLSVEQAKWVLDHHLARGINLFQTMSYLSSRETFRPYFCPPDLNLSPQWLQFATLHAYANRMSYLLSVGQPTAAIALYYPTTSGWLGDFSADAATLAIAQRLLENQRDFDFVDEQALQSGLILESAVLVNQSGQRYRTVIVPPVKVISEMALARLEAFAKAGGKVVFVKQWPELVAGKTYLHAVKGPTQLVWATLITETELFGSLPTPDLKLSTACPAVKHVHRRLADGEVYFLFNESDRVLDLTAVLQGAGAPEYWDAATGKRARTTAWSRQGDGVRLSLTLEPYESRTIVLGPATSQVKEVRPASKQDGDSIAIEGNWKLTISGKEFCGPLKTWAEYGEPGFCGTVRYTKEFNVPRGLADSKRGLHLDLGEVKYSARVRLNGKDLGSISWRPFRWPVGEAIRAGSNVLEVEITNTAANELAGNPERLAELEKKGWLLNSYVKRYLPFDKEMVPSGLLGPVRLVRYETVK